MRSLRLSIGIVSLVLILLSIIILLNFTAQNPTGRRYSSEDVLTTGGSGVVGDSGEQVLSRDLSLPINDSPEQGLCVCSQEFNPESSNNRCTTCYVRSDDINTHRIPDFVSPNFLADSKNVRSLSLDGQLLDFAVAANQLNVTLWIFVRVDTRIHADLLQAVRETGGDVVPYFTHQGYIDPWDVVAWRTLAGGAGIFLLVGVWEFGTRAASNRKSRTPRKRDVMTQAVDKVDNAVTLNEQLKERLRRRIDEGDSQEDSPDN